ncbi:MAG: putative Holliday junction resolvase [Patiriisocius sp.]|jgi:putative Holliday junction resolvase
MIIDLNYSKGLPLLLKHRILPKLLGIDYGTRRVGLAATDDLQIIASGIGAIDTKDIFKWLIVYLEANDVETIVFGLPKGLDNNDTNATEAVVKVIEKVKRLASKPNVVTVDERFTSKMAKASILESGVKKSKRRDKGLIDEVSAVLILQSYMSSKF